MAEAIATPTPSERPAKTVKKGDTLRLVTAKGERIEATCTDVVNAKRGLINLEAFHVPSHGIEKFAITSSPHDPEGKLPDSWHHAD